MYDSDLPSPRTLRCHGICISRDFARAIYMPLSESLQWGKLDGNVMLEIQSEYNRVENQTFLKIIQKAHFIHLFYLWPDMLSKLTADVCIKGHILPYFEVSANNSETPEN